MTSGNVTVAALVPNATSTQKSSGFQTYENQRLGFRIQYPLGWNVYNIKGGISFSSDNSTYGFDVYKTKKNPDGIIKTLKGSPDFSRSITLDGTNATEIVFTTNERMQKGIVFESANY